MNRAHPPERSRRSPPDHLSDEPARPEPAARAPARAPAEGLRSLAPFGRRLATAVGLALILVAGWRLAGYRPEIGQLSEAPVVMGTTCRLIAVGRPGELAEALAAARGELERVESAMSTYDPESELSRFNRAAAGTPVPLSRPTREVLAEARRFSERTGGAFDVTVRPLSKLWAESAEAGREPDFDELQAVRRRVGADKFTLGPTSATKHVAGLEISLDAIAKGYAIHRAVEAMRRFRLVGGLVDVGGDIECFGRPRHGDAWRIALQDPRGDGRLLTLRLGGESDFRAACTSGDYRRFVTIAGRRYSHVLDPRTGRPTQAVASVTVLGTDAFRADAWATALSVFGPDEGLPLLEARDGWQALFVVSDGSNLAIRRSPGFGR